MRLWRPMRVGPWMLQCGPTRVPSPISTSAPMKVNAPTSTPLPIRADGSTTALAWMDACATSDLDLGTQDVGAGDLLAVDAGRAAVLGHVADFALDRDIQVEEIGRASGRARVCQYVLSSVVAVSFKKKLITKYR